MPGARAELWKFLAAILLILYGALLFRANAAVAGGADSSGYSNAARLFARGSVSEDIEALSRLGLSAADQDLFIPLGFRPGAKPGTMAPQYPPGLPLHMAAAGMLAGWSRAPFLVSPLAAVAALVLLYLAARELGLSRALSAAGAALLAACPIFFGLAIQPMSDVLATAWVLAAVHLALRARRRENMAIAAGAALGVAVLVRPTNLLALFALAFALPPGKGAKIRALAGALPFAALLLVYNRLAFGSASSTGYGALLDWTMSPRNVLPEIRHYGYWVPALLTPLLPLAWFAVPFDRRVALRDRCLLLLWFGAFLGFYCFYQPFEDWWSVRFLLPGIPALILAALLLARDVPELLAERGGLTGLLRWRAAIGLALLLAMAAAGIRYIRHFDLFSLKIGEAAYPDAARWADRSAPPGAVIVSMQMSGALKYYTGRAVARWDAVTPGRFERLRRAARERGIPLYALLWPFEEKELAAKLPGRWTPVGTWRDIGLWRFE
jgi:hypothetical protein